MATSYERFRSGGTRRICSPSETRARIAPLLSTCGITRMANVTGLDQVGIPVVMVCRPNAASLSVAQGKGTDLEAARVSGLMEAIEHYHAESFAARELRLASSAEIAAESGIPDAWWPSGLEPRRPSQKQLWIQAETRRQQRHWVPFELVHLDLSVDHPLSHTAFPVSSNGLASGNCREEALLHGACELIERDALALFYDLPAPRQRQRRIDVATLSGETVPALLQCFARAGVQVGLWDISSDIGVAALLCAVLDSNPDASRRNGVAVGVGCHPEREVAAARALCEAAQSRLTRIAGSRDDILPDAWAAVRSPESEQRWRSLLLEGGPWRPFEAVPDHCFASLDEELDYVERRLQGAGVGPLLAVALSSDTQAPISVLRCLVPGLEAPSEGPSRRPPGLRLLAQRRGET